MISIHRDVKNLGVKSLYSDGWVVLPTDNPILIAEAIAKHMSSPCLWRDGRRLQAHWLAADWIALDFDKGAALSESVDTFRSFEHVIGTTKSHQKAKGTEPACDRFRVWLRLRERVNDLGAYRLGLSRLIKTWGADPQAGDGARMFMPCKEIVSIGKNGRRVELDTSPPKPVKRPRLSLKDYRDVPLFIQSWLAGGPTDRGKNDACYKIGLHLAKRGFDQSAIIDIIMDSNLPVDKSDPVRREVASAVRNGFRRGALES